MDDYTYLWTTTDGLISGNITNDTISGLPVGTYTVTVFDIFGCSFTDDITLSEPGSVETGSIYGNVTSNASEEEIYTVNQTEGSTYTWTVSGGNILSGQDTYSVNVQWVSMGTGTVSVLETTVNGCTGELVELNVDIGATSITDISSEGLIIYPNPSSGDTMIEYKDHSLYNYILRIYDLSGSKIIEEKIIGDSYIINHGSLSKGFYSIELTGSTVLRGKLIVR